MAAIPVDPREELERLERKHAENPEGRYFVPLADAYRRSGNISGAIDLLRAGLARHPDYLSAHVVLGRCYADSGESEAAEAEFLHVLSLDPQNLLALGTLGDIALLDGRRREAERWYQDLLTVDPMNDDAKTSLTRLRAEQADARADDEVQIGATDGEASPPRSAGIEHEQPIPEKDPLEDGVAEMDNRSDDDRGAFFDDDSEVVVTETIAELYTRQGFYDRAAGVYRELIRRRGGDGALETKLRRVEALASGLPDPEAAVSEADAVAPAVSDLTRLEPVDPPLDEDDTEIDAATPFYPLIGPVGEAETDGVSDLPAEEEAEAFVVPAYDFASPIGEAPGPTEGGYDDLDDLLLDPFSDPFSPTGATFGTELSARSFAVAGEDANDKGEQGFGGDLVQDPFADSFAEGFPSIDEIAAGEEGEAIPIAGLADLGDEDTPSTAVPSGLTIGAFLRSIASWKRVPPVEEDAGGAEVVLAVKEEVVEEVASGIDPAASDAADEPAEHSEAGEPQPRPEPEPWTTGWDVVDAAFDSALGHTPTDVVPDTLPEPVPTETSGTADPQPLDLDDLFPWEIPVPESAPATGPASAPDPLDLDSGYPFDEPPTESFTPVVGSPGAEATVSDSVDPAPASGDATFVEEATAGEPDASAADEAPPGDFEDRVADTPPSTPASAQDDDDLESFQAWLRSLKR